MRLSSSVTNKQTNESTVGWQTVQRVRPRDEAVQRAGAATPVASDDLLRFNYITWRAELDGVILQRCQAGQTTTYALLDERVPEIKSPSRDQALAELTRRYFT